MAGSGNMEVPIRTGMRINPKEKTGYAVISHFMIPCRSIIFPTKNRVIIVEGNVEKKKPPLGISLLLARSARKLSIVEWQCAKNSVVTSIRRKERSFREEKNPDPEYSFPLFNKVMFRPVRLTEIQASTMHADVAA